MNVRKTGGRTELDIYANTIRGMAYRLFASIAVLATITDGTTDGQLRTTVATVPKVGGVNNASLGSTDDFWDLSAETDTIAAQFRAYWLYVDSSNAATIVAGVNAPSEAAALRGLPGLDETKAIIGVYVAGVSTDFSNALAAQGTIFQGVPDGAARVIVTGDLTLVPA